MSEWIAVTDRLPPVGKMFAFYDIGSDEFTIGEVYGNLREDGRVFVESRHEYYAWLFTHWMPLPSVEGLACQHRGDESTAEVKAEDDKPAAAEPSLESLILGLRDNERLAFCRREKSLLIEVDEYDSGSKSELWGAVCALSDIEIEQSRVPLLVSQADGMLARLREVVGVELNDKPNQEQA